MLLLLLSFLVRPQDRFFVPTCAGAMTPRAGAFKAGRRSVDAANAGLDRPRLDDAEHGVMLGRVGTAAIASPAASYKKHVDYVVWVILFFIGCGVVYSVGRLIYDLRMAAP